MSFYLDLICSWEATLNTSIQNNHNTTNLTNEETKILYVRLHRKTRYESQQQYLQSYMKEKLIPNNFYINLDPSISNHNEVVLSVWNEKN